MDPYRAPKSLPPPPRDPMRTILLVTGALAGVIAAAAIGLMILERGEQRAVARVEARTVAPQDECSGLCGPRPPLHCPSGVEPTCARRDGRCAWDLPATCSTEPDCPNGGNPPSCNPALDTPKHDGGFAIIDYGPRTPPRPVGPKVLREGE